MKLELLVTLKIVIISLSLTDDPAAEFRWVRPGGKLSLEARRLDVSWRWPKLDVTLGADEDALLFTDVERRFAPELGILDGTPIMFVGFVDTGPSNPEPCWDDWPRCIDDDEGDRLRWIEDGLDAREDGRASRYDGEGEDDNEGDLNGEIEDGSWRRLSA